MARRLLGFSGQPSEVRARAVCGEGVDRLRSISSVGSASRSASNSIAMEAHPRPFWFRGL